MPPIWGMPPKTCCQPQLNTTQGFRLKAPNTLDPNLAMPWITTASNHSKPPSTGDRRGNDRVIGMCDLPPPHQPAREASILHDTGYHAKPPLAPAPSQGSLPRESSALLHDAVHEASVESNERSFPNSHP